MESIIKSICKLSQDTKIQRGVIRLGEEQYQFIAMENSILLGYVHIIINVDVM